jgi:hypothetical protein
MKSIRKAFKAAREIKRFSRPLNSPERKKINFSPWQLQNMLKAPRQYRRDK